MTDEEIRGWAERIDAAAWKASTESLDDSEGDAVRAQEAGLRAFGAALLREREQVWRPLVEVLKASDRPAEAEELWRACEQLHAEADRLEKGGK